jgi:hypothetical protein
MKYIVVWFCGWHAVFMPPTVSMFSMYCYVHRGVPILSSIQCGMCLLARIL